MLYRVQLAMTGLVWCIVFSVTNVVSSNPTHGEVYSIQHYVIKFVSNLRQIDGFIRVLRFPPLMKLTTTIKIKHCYTEKQ
jgi:hypothetical protein